MFLSLKTLFTRTATKALKTKTSKLSCEALESREMMSVTPAAPMFTTTAVSGSQVNVSWNAVAGATRYQIDEYINNNWVQISSSSSSGGIAVTGLTANTTYYFDVAASNSAGMTWAPYQTIKTPSASITPTPTPTPTNSFLAAAENHPTAGTSYSAVPETAANFANPTAVLFGSSQTPHYTDVAQGAEGDCWLLASLAEVAARTPNDIKNMFTFDGTATENGSLVGIYSVRFYNKSGVAQSVVVDTELPNGGHYYDNITNPLGTTALWVALAEKAYAEANGAGIVTTQHVGTDSYDAMNGGNPSWALQAITGKSANQFAINPTNIASAWNAGQLIVLGSSSTATSSMIVGDSSGTHAYAVVGYNASAANPFTIYNPWGTNSAGYAPGTFNGHQVYGQFTCNGAFLSQNFASQNFGTGTAVETAGQVAIAPETKHTTEFSTQTFGAPETNDDFDASWMKFAV